MGRVRRRGTDGVSQRASSLELFYDLVFVFAITQVSHLLLAHLTWTGVLQSLILLLAVYWSWNYTTWTTNELDTETIPVRLLLLGLMLVSLLMSVAIPRAFEDQALLFAGSYVAIQVGRHFFLTFVAADSGTVERERAGRILTWFVVVGVIWIAGALVEGTGRYVLWLIALALDYYAPLVTYRVPGRRRLPPETWNVGTEHFAERFGLFIILALGESIVITGGITSELELDVKTIIAFIMAFLASAAIWWLYFTSVAALGEHYLEVADHRTTLARDAYTYLHVVFVAGIILSAVGDELVIVHPYRDPASLRGRCGGGWPGSLSARPHALRLQVDGHVVQVEGPRHARLRRCRFRRPLRTGAGARGCSHRGACGGDRSRVSCTFATREAG